MKLVAVNYQQRRLQFFKEQLASAQRKLDFAIKRDYSWDRLEDKGEIVSFYEWAVQMAEKEKNKMYDDLKNSIQDDINHPKHYCREGGMECLEEMELVFGRDAVRTFCLLNAWKYRYRAGDKNGAEDLKKSDWYMRKYKELAPAADPYD